MIFESSNSKSNYNSGHISKYKIVSEREREKKTNPIVSMSVGDEITRVGVRGAVDGPNDEREQEHDRVGVDMSERVEAVVDGLLLTVHQILEHTLNGGCLSIRA